MRSLEALDRLRDSGVVQIAGVVTQPDRPASRGVMREPAVKVAARAMGLPVRQPARLDDKEIAAILALRPELLVWSAYGNKIPKALLAAVSGRALNVHASLLPRWRGAAPIAHAILAGDPETGVTLMEGTAELDAGPILAQTRTKIGDETIELGGISFETIQVPGHSPGHLAFYADLCLFSGDVLFAGSVGRTDLPMADWETLLESIRTLVDRFPPETVVYSGHGPPTTLGAELARNPFLAELRA